MLNIGFHQYFRLYLPLSCLLGFAASSRESAIRLKSSACFLLFLEGLTSETIKATTRAKSINPGKTIYVFIILSQ